ncbi:hypothetical protein TNIN_178851, partial [Trichonephila inaurata madagascariensis]
MHPLLENINLFDISSLTEENVKDILTEARVLPEKTSTPMCSICGNKTSANRDSSRKLGWMWICKKKYQLKCSGKFSLGSIEYVPKKKRTANFYARLRKVTEIIGSHHDKLLLGP